MRFVSKYPRLGLGTCIKEKFVLALDGQRDLAPDAATGYVGSLSVQFGQDDLTQADIDFALSVWPESSFQGRWIEEDGITQEPVAGRIGVYDTEKQGFDDAIREHVEQWILAKSNLDIDFVQVPDGLTRAAKPWPSYDSTHHNKIASLAVELGLVGETLAYERENRERPSVIEQLEAALASPVEVEAGEVVSA